jgi:hypothetical protein
MGHGYSLSDVVFGPSPACAANPTPTTQPPPATKTATICAPNLTCPSGACLSQNQEASLCISKLGTQICPMGYPNGTVYAPTYDDTRTCSSCTCGSALTCTLTSVLIDNRPCVAGPDYFMYATTSCNAAPFEYPINNVKANAKIAGDPTCVQTAPSNPMGGVQLNQGTISTVCCK